MPEFVVPNSARVRIHWDLAGDIASTALGGSGAGASAVGQTMADNLSTAFRSALASSGLEDFLPTSVSLVNVSVRNVNSAAQTEYFGSGAPAPGTLTTDLLPRSAALVVTLRTALAGKSFRGRSFLSGFAEVVNQSDATIAAGAIAAALAFITACQSAMSAQGLTLSILSPALPSRVTKGGVTLPPKAAFSNAVTAIEVRNSAWGSQRMRNQRR